MSTIPTIRQRLSLLGYRLTKAVELVPSLMLRPKRVAWLLRGATPGRLLALDIEWLRDAPIRTVIDVGANTGQFARTIHCLFPHAEIHSFEPLADCHASLVERMGATPGFHGYAVALGEEDGTTEFHRNAFTQASSALPMAPLHREALRFTGDSEVITVPIRSLDSVFAAVDLPEQILMKVDVQGFEERVLAGASKTLESVAFVVVETSLQTLYEGQSSFDSVYERMTGSGFRYAGNIDQLLDPRDGSVMQIDALFVRGR